MIQLSGLTTSDLVGGYSAALEWQRELLRVLREGDDAGEADSEERARLWAELDQATAACTELWEMLHAALAEAAVDSKF